MKLFLVSVLLFISTYSFSQKETEKLKLSEKYRLGDVVFSEEFDAEDFEVLIDSLYKTIEILAGEDFYGDSNIQKSLIMRAKSDSLQLDTLAVCKTDFFFSRGGSISELDDKSTSRKREKEMVFNMIEIQDFASRNHKIPFTLIDRVTFYTVLTGISGKLEIFYAFDCLSFTEIEIKERTIIFNNEKID